MIHELKTWPEFYDLVAAGVKNYEVRKDDRGFKVNDILQLHKYNPETEKYCGVMLQRRITHILRGPQFGIKKGFVILSITDL